MGDTDLQAKLLDLETRNHELEERVRVISIQHHQHAFSNVIDALQYGALTPADLAAYVSVERVRAALFVPPFTPHV